MRPRTGFLRPLACTTANRLLLHWLPAIGRRGDYRIQASLFYHLLPHLEQPGTYQRFPPFYTAPASVVLAGSGAAAFLNIANATFTPDDNAAQFKVPSYICPSDITGDSTGVTSSSGFGPAGSAWGENCYAANFYVFGLVTSPKLPESVPDGLSSTIFFAEKAPICSGVGPGGNLWAAAPFFPTSPASNYGGTFGYDNFAAGVNAFRIPNTKTGYSGTFQTIAPGTSCDPRDAGSPHDSGINVAMGDGSARFISNSISATTWAALVTPYPIPAINIVRPDVPGPDWAN